LGLGGLRIRCLWIRFLAGVSAQSGVIVGDALVDRCPDVNLYQTCQPLGVAFHFAGSGLIPHSMSFVQLSPRTTAGTSIL
jgi:hypothetical protein